MKTKRQQQKQKRAALLPKKSVKFKNAKYKQRGKEMVDSLRSQIELEKKYATLSEQWNMERALLEAEPDVPVNEPTLDLLVSTLTEEYETDTAQLRETAAETETIQAKQLSLGKLKTKQSKSVKSEYICKSLPEKQLLQIKWPALQGNLQLPENSNETETATATTALATLPEHLQPTELLSKADLSKTGIKPVLATNVSLPLTQLQLEFFHIINNYYDIYYNQMSLQNAQELRSIYCLHTLNHLLKKRGRIKLNNLKLLEAKQKNSKQNSSYIIPESCRDQGLNRTTILIVVPFRQKALHIVQTLAQLLFGQKDEKQLKSLVLKYERFLQEYGGDSIYFAKTNPKPQDYMDTFAGNTDDNFRIGIAVQKKCLKLYTDFYSSDIVIVSPLGLRLVINDEEQQDYDFLSSIEMLIIEHAELIYAQNWENLLLIMQHMHLQPQKLHDVDFQRVHSWCLDGLSHLHRQTLLLSSHDLPEFRALFNGNCHNYRGKLRCTLTVPIGDINRVVLHIPQTFSSFAVSSLEAMHEERFNHFMQQVLPKYRSNSSLAHCLIYVASYFDYVRLRNYFKKERISFVQICEYTKKDKMARARDVFFHSGAQFLLYTERAHFYRRTRIKGIRNLLFYQLPTWPHFYSELVNLMHEANQNPNDGLESSMSVTALYSKYDMLQLSYVVSSKTAEQIASAKINAYTFVTK